MKVWQHLWGLISFQPGTYFLNALSRVIKIVLPLAQGLIMREIFDHLTGHAHVTLGIWSLMAFFAALTAVEISLLFGGEALDVLLRATSSALLRRNLLVNILKRPGAQALHTTPGECVSRFRDDVKVIENTVSNSLDPVSHAVFMTTALAVMVNINLFITLVVVLPLVAVWMLIQTASNRIQKYRRASQEAVAQVTGFLGDMFSIVQAVKLASAEKQVVEHLRLLNERRRRTMIKDKLFGALLRSATWNMVNLGIGLILLAVGRSMRAGTFTVGDFVLFVFYLQIITETTGFVGLFLTQYKQSQVSFERLSGLLPSAPAKSLTQHSPVYLRSPLPALTYLPKTNAHRLENLEATGLTYIHPATGRGIEGISLSLKRGTRTVITGRIGSGKTTLLRILLGLLPKDAGEIRWNGKLIEDPAEFFVPPRCGYVSQVPRLFSETLRDNILMGLPEENVDLSSALWSAVMEREVKQLENGLDTIIGPKGVKLSGGQIQRTAAARAFVREPELLVMDDLSSALDVETERIMWERILKRREVTCLAVSHRRTPLRAADHIIVLRDGRIEAEGSLKHLLKTCEEMQRLFEGNGDLR